MRTLIFAAAVATVLGGLGGPAAAIPPEPLDPCNSPRPPKWCTAGSPTGTLAEVRRDASGLVVAGTASDPDGWAPVVVSVTVNGVATGTLTASGAGGSFAGTVPARAGNTVCAIAINQGTGDDAGLGCRSIQILVNPIGHLDEVRSVTGGIRARGWVIDPDATAPAQVRLLVDGVVRTVQPAGQNRPDVGAAYPGYGAAHGFDIVIPGGGRHTGVCAEGVNVGPGADGGVGCGRDGNAISVFNLNIRGVHEQWDNDDRTGAATIPWRDRYDRIASWMAATGTVPDVITLQEAWLRKFWLWAVPPNHNPHDYETLFVLVDQIRARTGVNYRIAYADAPYTPNGINQLYAGHAMLYNADRLRNTTALVNSLAVAETDTSTLGVHMRVGFPCQYPLAEQAPMCSLIDLDGRHWASSYLDSAGTWKRGPTAATFELLGDPGKHILVHNVHAEPSAEADAAMRGLVDGLWARWLPRTKLLPPIVAGDFNGSPALADFDATVSPGIDFILLGKASSYPSTVVPYAATEVFPAQAADHPHCGTLATLVSDHCAVFAQYLPTG